MPTALDVTDNCTAGEIRLTEGQTRYEGLVEICWKNSWKSICPSSWDNSEAQVVCRQLGFTSIGLYQYWHYTDCIIVCVYCT